MRFQPIVPFCCVIALGLASNACSLLGTYAGSASSMMSQPSAGAGATPANAPGTPASTSTPTAGQSSSESAKEASAPTSVSVTLRSSCSETVKVFFGDKPKFGSGRYSSVSGNSRSNQSFRPGDQLWIVDDGQNGVANVTIEAGTKEIEVTSSCDAFRTH